jgi:hypothetical protein
MEAPSGDDEGASRFRRAPFEFVRDFTCTLRLSKHLATHMYTECMCIYMEPLPIIPPAAAGRRHAILMAIRYIGQAASAFEQAGLIRKIHTRPGFPKTSRVRRDGRLNRRLAEQGEMGHPGRRV